MTTQKRKTPGAICYRVTQFNRRAVAALRKRAKANGRSVQQEIDLAVIAAGGTDV